MQYEFCGKWSNTEGAEIEIEEYNRAYKCTLAQNNIGIMYRNSLIVSEFGEGAPMGGIGVYSPVGDGSSLYALWSSTKTGGLLGSGIALKADGKAEFCGDYSVRYFVGDNEAGIFSVTISLTLNPDIYGLLWSVDNREVLHGIGMMAGDGLAFAWGPKAVNFDFTRFYMENGDGKTVLSVTAKMGDMSLGSDKWRRI